MSSRVGARPSGSDGNDFRHRERVAEHYLTSSANKSRLRYVVYLHLLLIVLMLARLSVAIAYLFNTRPPLFLEQLGLPAAWLWEYVWLCSAVPALFALVAVRKNRVMLLKQYMLGSVLFGLGPVFIGVIQLFGDLLNYWETRETKDMFAGFPVVLLWNMFLFIALQVHGFGLALAWTLVQAWRPKKKSS